MTMKLGGLSRRSFLRTGTAFGLAAGVTGLKTPAFAQSGLGDIQAILDGISVEGYVREDYRKLYNMDNTPLWDPAKDWIRTVDWEKVRSELAGTTVRFAIGAGVDPQRHAEFEKRFGYPLVEIWGMTEMVRAIFDADVPPTQRRFIPINAELSEDWPVITRSVAALPDADDWARVQDKASELDRREPAPKDTP